MRLTRILLGSTLLLAMLLVGCKSKSAKSGFAPPKAAHEVVVKEQIQTSNYTYFRVSEEDQEYWIAGVKMEANVGEKLYYNTYYEMVDFKSTELERTFDQILFIQDLSKNPSAATPAGTPSGGMQMGTPTDANPASGHGAVAGSEPTVVETIDKEGLEVVKEVVELKTLLANPTDYADKLVKVKGKITKVNPAIMGTNWIHLTTVEENASGLDFTVTTQDNLAVDDVITIEGKITLNKDFGAGYFYSIIMEEGEVLK